MSLFRCLSVLTLVALSGCSSAKTEEPNPKASTIVVYDGGKEVRRWVNAWRVKPMPPNSVGFQDGSFKTIVVQGGVIVIENLPE
jgi:uncharacterized protein YceK